MRRIEVIGRIVADAERKMGKSGKEFISFRVANNEYYDEKDADGKQKTYWFSVISSQFVNMAQYLTKGKPVLIRGDYSDRVYQNKDGNCEIGRDIRATEIVLSPFGQNEKTQQTTLSTQTVVTNEPKVEAPKPTTAEIKIPTQTVDDDDDNLPF